VRPRSIVWANLCFCTYWAAIAACVRSLPNRARRTNERGTRRGLLEEH
jgi:hypothetical protein